MLTIDEVLADVAAAPGFSGRVEINSRGSEGQTPLHWMATLGDATGIELLLRAGANIDAADSQGNTPLHEAVLCRQRTAVAVLLKGGANVHLKNVLGLTPRALAEAERYSPVLELL
jgi:uncharacterized protein